MVINYEDATMQINVVATFSFVGRLQPEHFSIIVVVVNGFTKVVLAFVIKSTDSII